MYSNRSSLPFGVRPVGLGAAFVVNGALLTALYLFIAPHINPIIQPTILEGTNIPLTPPPPPIPDKPKPTTDPIRETVIYQPPVTIAVPVEGPKIDTTTVIPPSIPLTPEVGKPAGTGEVKPVEPPLPPLVVAQIDPRYASAFQPEYPAQELRNERDGKVSVRVLIGTDGRVKAVEQVSATSPAFFDATKRQAISKWRFKPANRGGTPQESWKVMSVRFEIKGQQ